jgi:uncharacterized repeat protein (TIGR03847 family)
MAERTIDLDPIDHITIDAIGKPGQRTFYIQAWCQNRTFTFLIEKVQIQTLAIGYERFLTEISERFPEISETKSDFEEDKMIIQPPVDPYFRVGEMGLSYDEERDLVILIVREMDLESENPGDETRTVRLWCTRPQLRSMCAWGLLVASRGRPICPYCGQPMEPEGHYCPKKNGRHP